MTPELRCAARLHSLDMAQRAFFDHVNPDGADPSLRMLAAGYVGSVMGENIAYGQSSPQLVHGGWMLSDGHCSNVLSGLFTEIGIGYHLGGAAGQHYWTQNFGRR
jgi:uncharacterized protein YkwD